MINQCKKHNYLLSNIENMDETLMIFDMIRNWTVSSKGDKTIVLKTTGHQTIWFTVVLAGTANSMKGDAKTFFSQMFEIENLFMGYVPAAFVF